MARRFLVIMMMVAGLFIFSGKVMALTAENAGGQLSQVGQWTGMESDLGLSLGNIINAFLVITGTVFFLLTVYAGIRLMIAQGNDEKVTKAKETLQAAAIGVVIVALAYAITAFVTSRVSGGGVGSVEECNARFASCINDSGREGQCPDEYNKIGTCANQNNWPCCVGK